MKTETKKQTVTLNNENRQVLATIRKYPEIRASLFFKGNKDSKLTKAERFNFIPSRALNFLKEAGFVKMSEEKTYTITAAGNKALATAK